MIVRFGLAPDHALPQNVAVRLVVIRGDACAQPVSLVIATQCAPASFAFCHEGHARLTRASVELAERVSVCVLVRECIERRWNVAAGRLGAVNSFTRYVASRREEI